MAKAKVDILIEKTYQTTWAELVEYVEQNIDGASSETQVIFAAWADFLWSRHADKSETGDFNPHGINIILSKKLRRMYEKKHDRTIGEVLLHSMDHEYKRVDDLTQALLLLKNNNIALFINYRGYGRAKPLANTFVNWSTDVTDMNDILYIVHPDIAEEIEKLPNVRNVYSGYHSRKILVM